MNFDRLLKLASRYNLFCLAGLREDMAERIMFSTLPSAVSREQVSSTGGVVDYNALKWAAEGRFNIIKYGLLACIDELMHYKQAYGTPHFHARDLFNKGKYKECIELCIKSFSHEKAWRSSYGGELWVDISKQLSKIIELNEQLKAAKELHDVDEEVNLMKKIIVELNIFDGMSHNTSSIMTSLIKEEVEDDMQIRKLQKGKLYDNVELNNYRDFYEEIKPHLDHIERLKKFFKKDDDNENRLNSIKMDLYSFKQRGYSASLPQTIISSIRAILESVSFKQIERLMDSKELRDSKETFVEVEPYIAEPYKYHDYIPKLKSNIKPQDNDEQIQRIKLRKILSANPMNLNSSFNVTCLDLGWKLTTIEEHLNNFLTNEEKTKVKACKSNIDKIIKLNLEYRNTPVMRYINPSFIKENELQPYKNILAINDWITKNYA